VEWFADLTGQHLGERLDGSIDRIGGFVQISGPLCMGECTPGDLGLAGPGDGGITISRSCNPSVADKLAGGWVMDCGTIVDGDGGQQVFVGREICGHEALRVVFKPSERKAWLRPGCQT